MTYASKQQEEALKKPHTDVSKFIQVHLKNNTLSNTSLCFGGKLLNRKSLQYFSLLKYQLIYFFFENNRSKKYK